MVLEHAQIRVNAGQEDSFESAFHQAREILASCPGCRSVRMTRGIEDPTRFLLLVEWDSIEDHLVGFRQSDRFGQWRALIGPFFDGPPEVDHYQDLTPA